MLVELSVVEQRNLAVREALDTRERRSPTSLASTGSTEGPSTAGWSATLGGLGALADRSFKPDRCPHEISPELEARIAANPTGRPRRVRDVAWVPKPFRDTGTESSQEIVESSSAPRCLSIPSPDHATSARPLTATSYDRPLRNSMRCSRWWDDAPGVSTRHRGASKRAR
jgi:hypothetical protein